MDDGSVISQFQFLSFKIDQASFEMMPRVGNVELESIPRDTLDIKLAFRNPQRMRENRQYIVGLGLSMESFTEDRSEQIFSLTMGISGLFLGLDLTPDSPEERQFVQYQAPALLFSHIRGAITSFLANAGFSGIIIPLVNVYALARDSETVIEDLSSSQSDTE